MEEEASSKETLYVLFQTPMGFHNILYFFWMQFLQPAGLCSSKSVIGVPTAHEKKAEDSKGGGGHRLGEEYWHEQMKTNRKSAASKKELKGKESIWLGKCLLERTKILSKVRHSETSSFFLLDASPVAQHLRTFVCAVKRMTESIQKSREFAGLVHQFWCMVLQYYSAIVCSQFMLLRRMVKQLCPPKFLSMIKPW